jgi:YD repeat-containing protein
MKPLRPMIWLTMLALAAAGSPALAAETRQYDAIGRLTDIAYDGGSSIHYTFDANGNILSIVSSTGTTAVDGHETPPAFALGPATPNPGAGPRTIAFAIPSRGHVTLRVLDVSGREVARLFDRALEPGRYSAQFSTARWRAGAYFYRLDAGGHSRSGRLIVLQ